MKTVHRQHVEISEKLSLRAAIRVLVSLVISLRPGDRRSQPWHDLHRLDARLQRDAGMDELDQERTKAAKAPLIR